MPSPVEISIDGHIVGSENPLPIGTASASIVDYWVARAEAEVFATYADTVSVAAKDKSLLKFGRNDNIGTAFETVWIRGGDETYATGNTIDTISSSDAGDSQDVKIEGHTISGSDLTFVVQTPKLNGQNKVVLGTPLYRSSRAYNDDSVDLAGTLYVYEDDTITNGEPDTLAKIHLQSDGANNQSSKAATSFSSVDYCFITTIYLAVDRQNSRSVDYRFQVRESGKVFRTRWSGAANTGSGLVAIDLRPFIIIPPNSDVRFRAISSGTTTGVEAGFNSLLAVKL